MTDKPFNQTEGGITESTASGWLRTGLNTLPNSFKQIPYSDEYVTTALIYEFQKKKGEDLEFNPESRLPARTHLEVTKITSELSKK